MFSNSSINDLDLHDDGRSTASSQSSNSLANYYARTIDNERIGFTTVDGAVPDFGLSSENSFLSNAQTVSSINTDYRVNRALYKFHNLTSRHKAWEILTILVLMLGFAGRYFNTSHIYLLKNDWKTDQQVTDAQFRVMLAVSILVFCGSKIILGIITDRFVWARQVFIISSLGAAVGSILFALGHHTGWFIISFMILAVSIPGTWVGLMGVIAHWIPISRQGRILGVISCVFLLGSGFTTMFVEGTLIYAPSWRAVLVVCAVVCIVFNAPAMLFLKSSPKKVHLPEPPTRTMNSVTTSSKPKSVLDVVKPLFRLRAVWLLILLAIFVYGMNQFFIVYSYDYVLENYCETYYEMSPTVEDCESSQLSKERAFWISLLFPFSGAISALFVGRLKDGIAKRHRCSLLVSFLTAFLVFLITMDLLSGMPYIWVAAMFVFFCGFTLVGPFTLLAGSFALDIGGRYRSATLAGFVDGVGFCSASVVMMIYKNYPEYSYLLLFVLTICAILVSIIMWVLEARARKKESHPLDRLVQYDEDDDDDNDEKGDRSSVESSSSPSDV